LGYHLELSDKAKDYIADKGFDQKYGARPLNRAIQKYVEDVVAEEIISAKVKEGDTITMDLNEQADGLTVTVKKATKKKTQQEKTEESEKSE
jgi:ATP-dependent Clp protease ATP-binding subunit ClpC